MVENPIGAGDKVFVFNLVAIDREGLGSGSRHLGGRDDVRQDQAGIPDGLSCGFGGFLCLALGISQVISGKEHGEFVILIHSGAGGIRFFLGLLRGGDLGFRLGAGGTVGVR